LIHRTAAATAHEALRWSSLLASIVVALILVAVIPSLLSLTLHPPSHRLII